MSGGQCQCPWPPPGPVGRDPRAPAPVDMWEILRETQITLNELTKTINRIEALVPEHGYRTKAGLLTRVEGLLRHATRGWSKCPAECCDGLGTRIGT